MRLILLVALFISGHAQARTYGWIQFFDPQIEREAIGEQAGDPVDLLTSEHVPKSKLQEIEKRLASQGLTDPKIKTDYAGILLLLHGPGAAERAISLLREAEQEMPAQYVIAVNAATALELGNFYEEAANWLGEARSRNPQAHLGSEWLQALIVRAEQEIAADPEWLNSNSVLGESFGRDDLPTLPKVPDIVTWTKRAKHALFHQLRGRLRFAESPDPLIGDLLFDYGNLLVVTGNAKGAAKVYELAIKYQPPQMQLADRRFQKAKAASTGEETGSSRLHIYIIAFIVFGALGAVFAARFRSKKVRNTDT